MLILDLQSVQIYPVELSFYILTFIKHQLSKTERGIFRNCERQALMQRACNHACPEFMAGLVNKMMLVLCCPICGAQRPPRHEMHSHLQLGRPVNLCFEWHLAPISCDMTVESMQSLQIDINLV